METGLGFYPLSLADIPTVFTLEKRAYLFPWTAQMLGESLAQPGEYWGMHNTKPLSEIFNNAVFARQIAEHFPPQILLGYFFMGRMVDEMQVLTFTVHPDFHQQGLGTALLAQAIARARAHAMRAIFLEVRASNLSALRLYHRAGFRPIGLRKQYYPASNATREDALCLRLCL